MVNYCSRCFETGNKCQKADDDSLTCQHIVDNPAALRLATGGYAAQLAQASNALSGIAPPHVDAIINYTATAATETALSANEQSILDTEGNAEPYDGLELANLELGLSLARKRPAKYDGLKARLEKLVTLSTTQVNILKVQTILNIMANDLIERSRVQAANPTTNSTTYKESTYPLYHLWGQLIKKALHGNDLAEEVDQKTLFDAATGKTYVPFEKMPKCKTPAHLFRAFAMFKEAVTVLHCLAPRAWSGLESQVYRTEAAVGFLIAQQFVEEVLRRLDLKEYPNVGALMACGEHNRILDDLRPPAQLAGQGVDNGNKLGGKKVIKLGPVTKQGQFASLITDKDGKPLACNAHKKGEPCKVGVAAGQGLDAHAGKCAYDHPV